MTIAELDATFARLGLPSADEQAYARYRRIVRGRWEVSVDGDRGERHVTRYADEDELARTLLVEALLAHPELSRGSGAHAPVDATPTRAGRGFRLRWTRPVAPSTSVLARGAGVVVLRDTSMLAARGPDGMLLHTVLDVASGRELWSAAVPVGTSVAIAGDVVLRWNASGVAARIAGTGDLRWRVSWSTRGDSSPRLLAAGADHAVFECGSEPSCVAVALADGREVWRTAGSRLESKTRTDVEVTRLVRVECVGERVRVSGVALADGVERVLVEVTCPPAFREVDLTIAADEIDDAGVGLVLVRGRGRELPRETIGDLVLVAGEAEPTVFRVARGQFARRVDGAHLLLSPRDPDRGVTTVLRHVDGTERWRRRGWSYLMQRRPGLTVLSEAEQIVAVADTGAECWCRPGRAVVVRPNELWLLHDGELTAVDPSDGATRWTAPAPELLEIGQGADGLLGHREVDGRVLSAGRRELRAWG